ncbi:MAG: TIGR02281 family clan AA aspartic protease [Hyphomicrobiales bacterium]
MRSANKHMLLEAMQWGALALGALAFVYFFDEIRAVFGPTGSDLPSLAEMTTDHPAEDDKAAGFTREVKLRPDRNGHFVFKAAVNERLATFMADTGATLVVLTYEDAEHLGLSPRSLDFSAPVQTANGVTFVAPVMLDRVRVEDIMVRNVPAAVASKGALATNLLGMSFLGRLKNFQIQNGELVLIQ